MYDLVFDDFHVLTRCHARPRSQQLVLFSLGPLTPRLPVMSLLFELGPGLKNEIASLQPAAGYCIFIDSVGSTALKDSEPRIWLSRLHDIFALAKTYLKEFQPLKTIGDAIMYYIAEEELNANDQTALTLHLGLCFLVQETAAVFGQSKAAIAHCKDAYRVTFVPGTEDIYGKDIDLSARLLSVAQPGEIIMNERFATAVVARAQGCSSAQ